MLGHGEEARGSRSAPRGRPSWGMNRSRGLAASPRTGQENLQGHGIRGEGPRAERCPVGQVGENQEGASSPVTGSGGPGLLREGALGGSGPSVTFPREGPGPCAQGLFSL